MSDQLHKLARANVGASQDLVSFYDEFVELQDAYAFLGDAITALLRANAELDHATMEGIAAFVSEAKQNSAALRLKLRDILVQQAMGARGGSQVQ